MTPRKSYRDLTVLMTLARGLPFLYCPRTPFYTAQIPTAKRQAKREQPKRIDLLRLFDRHELENTKLRKL